MKTLGAGYIQEGADRTGDQYILLVALEVAGSHLFLQNSNEETLLALPPWEQFAERVPYVRANMTVDALSSNTSNEFPLVNLTISVVPDGIVAAYVKGQGGLRGKLVYLVRTFRSFIGTDNENTCRERATLTIDTTNVTDEQVSFSLTSPLVISGLTVPRRRYYRDFCSRKYLDGYVLPQFIEDYYCNEPDGSATGCKRTVADCRARRRSRMFGGFISIPRTRVRVR